MKNFKSMILAASVATLLMAGCAAITEKDVNIDDYEVQGQKIASVKYASTELGAVDEVRFQVNALFSESYDIYKEYDAIAQADSDNATVMNKLKQAEAEMGDAKKAYESLSEFEKNILKEFSVKNDKLFKRVTVLAKDMVAKQLAFNKIDTGSLLKEVKFSKLMDAKEQLGLTGDQLLFIDDTIGAIYRDYKTLQRNMTAI